MHIHKLRLPAIVSDVKPDPLFRSLCKLIALGHPPFISVITIISRYAIGVMIKLRDRRYR